MGGRRDDPGVVGGSNEAIRLHRARDGRERALCPAGRPLRADERGRRSGIRGRGGAARGDARDVPGRVRRTAEVALGALLVLGPAGANGRAEAAAAPGRPPDIVLIVTDDQRFDSLWAMPVLSERLEALGVTFPDAFVVNPLCCPSRASILTGNYSHTTLVYRQVPPFGRFEWFDDGSTLATWLHDAGHRTGVFGKYPD